MGKKKLTIETHRHRKINKYGVIECFGSVHPKTAEHKRESTQEAHDFSVELDAIGLSAMREKFRKGKI